MSAIICHVREGLDEETREDWRVACRGLDYYREHEGERYCVLHFPGEVKTDAFSKAVNSKLAGKNHDFSGTVFPKGTSNGSNV